MDFLTIDFPVYHLQNFISPKKLNAYSNDDGNMIKTYFQHLIGIKTKIWNSKF